MTQKRVRTCVHDNIKNYLSLLQDPQIMHSLSFIDFSKSSLGIENGKNNSIVNQVSGFKELHPDKIIIVRVGEFYQSFGVDAIILISIMHTSPIKGKDVQTSFHLTKIQTVLNNLLLNNFNCVIYEESGILKTPRMRFISQIVTKANPFYMHASTQDDNESIGAKPYGSVHISSEGTSICLVYVQERVCKVLHKVSETAASALLSNACTPILVLRNKPNWLLQESIVLGGMAPNTSIVERTLQRIEEELKIKSMEFRIIQTSKNQCSPISEFSAAQLGLRNNIGVPSLIDHCLPLDAKESSKTQLKQWLLCPPTISVSKLFQSTLSTLLESNESINNLKEAQPGKRLGLLQARNINANTLNDIRCNAFSCSLVKFEDLKKAVREQLDLKTNLNEGEIICNIIDQTLSEQPNIIKDSRGSNYDIVTYVHLHLLYTNQLVKANMDLNEYLSTYNEMQICRESKGIFIRGRSETYGGIKIPGREGIFTTTELILLTDAVAKAAEELKYKEADLVNKCANLLETHQSELCIVEMFAVQLKTLWYHARACKHWTMANFKEGGCINIKNLKPYWMTSAVVNEVNIDNNTILTAPNGGGKTTLLRSIAAVAILAHCGLRIPCEYAELPYFSNIFIRSGTYDCVQERCSSFSNECMDIAAIMRCEGKTLMLIDEPCKSTDPIEGVKLLKAIIQSLNTNITAVVSTHYHSLDLDNEVSWLQLGATVDGMKCIPTYKLRKGRCSNSLTFHVAMACGIETDIVKKACNKGDVETLALSVLYNMNLNPVQCDVGSLLPANLKSAVYMLITQKENVKAVYIGESDKIVRRFMQHNEKKIINTFIISMNNKSDALKMETLLQKELSYHDVELVSLTDSFHEVFN